MQIKHPIDRTDLILARHQRLKGRSQFSPRHQFGALSATLAFEDDLGVLDETEFQQRVIGTIDTVERKVLSLEKKFQEIHKDPPKEIKEALEAITKLQRVANDQQANVVMLERRIKNYDEQMRQHARRDFGDPIRNIQNDPEMKARLNIYVRLAVAKGTELLSRRMIEQAEEMTGLDINELLQAERARSIKSVVAGPEHRALGEDSSPGSLLIDDKLANEIYDTLATFGIWNTFQVDRVGSQTTKYPVTTARPTANVILTEAGTISDGSVTGTSVSNVMEVIAALINVSLQLVQDSEFDLTSYVMGLFGEAYSERLDHLCLGADGTADATNGGMTGVFQGGTAATADAGAGADDTVEELEFEDWTRCLLTVDPVVLNRDARWWMHPQILIRALSVKDLNGRPLFLTALEAPSAGALGSILGYPIVPAFKAPNTNSASQKVAVFGDRRGLAVGVRSDFVFEASDHHRWNTLERSFRGWGRAGTKIRRALAFAVLTLGA